MYIDKSPTVSKQRKQMYTSTVRVVLQCLFVMVYIVFPIFLAIGLMHIFAETRWALISKLVGLATMIFALVTLFPSLLTASGFFALWIRSRLAAKVARELLVDAPLDRALLVGFAPGLEPRMYGGDTAWDVGFLVLESGRLRYLGDVSAFDLRVDQIERVDIDRSINIFGFRPPRLAVFWRESPSQELSAFALEVWDGLHAASMRRITEEAVEWVKLWHADQSHASAVNELGLPPDPRSIKGQPLIGQCQGGIAASLAALAVCLAGAILAAGLLALMCRVFGWRISGRVVGVLMAVLTVIAWRPCSKWFQELFDQMQRK